MQENAAAHSEPPCSAYGKMAIKEGKKGTMKGSAVY